MIRTEDFAQLEVRSAAQLRDWLLAHHGQLESVWLVTFKKPVADKYVSHEAVLDALLCFGWIDGVMRKLDVTRTMQLVGPRRAQHWAKSYKDRAARLERDGLMHAAGLAAIELSKQRGLWEFMDDVDALELPEDLIAALIARPPAADHFGRFPPSSQRAALRWIKLARSPATRSKRIEQAAALAAQNLRVPGS